MKMNKSIITIGMLLTAVLAMTVMASAAELEDTSVDYTQYREIVAGEAGVVYKINLLNTGEDTQTYEVVPDTDAVRSVGTYRIDPDYEIELRPNQKATLSFYLKLEKDAPERLVIPVQIISGDDSITIDLTARKIGPFIEDQTSGFWSQLLKILFFTLIVIVLIALIATLFKRKDKGGDDKAEVETYY